ncbi:MAG: hypothetical protein IJ628_03400 [Bacteroidaceae bacterium]|nr:hypothetical protein [Bacteroidaceae bacterium]
MDTSRSFPNSVSSRDEVFTKDGGGYVRFYPEDEERMKHMSAKESILFKRSLIGKRRYYHEKDSFTGNSCIGSNDGIVFMR